MRTRSSSIIETLPEGKVFVSFEEKLKDPTLMALVPKLSLIQVAQVRDDRQAEY